MSVDWNARYQSGDTPWDKGEPHPELPFLLAEHKKILGAAKTILVPGCGVGHDARLIADSCKAKVTGLDLAEEAIERARQHRGPTEIEWRVGDLFCLQEKVDLIFEHTCFCAISLESRSRYVESVSRLLPVGGHLLGIFFLNPDHEGEEGPPFGVRRDELENFFSESFELVWSLPPSQTYPSRTGDGRELSILFRRRG